MIVRVSIGKYAVGLALVALIGWFTGQTKTLSQTSEPSRAAKAKMPAGTVRFAPEAPELSSLKVISVSAQALPLSEPISARIAYDESVTTRITSPVLGRVLALHAEIGDAVTRGTVLAEIDSPDLASAEADWRKARADQVRKKLALDRAHTLLDAGVLARKDAESAEADFQQAEAETRRASLRLKNLNADGKQDGRFTLKAPLAGIVVDRQINPGAEVRPELPNPLFVITDFSRLWVIVDVPERDAAELRLGQAVTLETDAYPGRLFPAKIDRIALALDPATRRIQVRCAVRNADHRLKPEMFAKAAFLAGDGSEQAIALPNTSLFTEGMYTYVFIERQPGWFERRRVTVRVKGRDNSFIDAGVRTGERVVTEGAFLLNAEAVADAK